MRSAPLTGVTRAWWRLPDLMIASGRPAVAGRLMQREVDVLGGISRDPARPYVAILGGAKVSDKLGVIASLIDRVDVLLIGGAMASTVIAARGGEVAESLVERDRFDDVRDALAAASARGVLVEVPLDVVAADEISADVETHTVSASEIPRGLMALDIGPRTVARFAELIADAKTILWNGPMGVFELAPFAAGTRGIATSVAAANAFTVVGGGDSLLAVREAGVQDRFDHLSTGGGASLEFLEGRTLPGIEDLGGSRETMTQRRPIIAANWKMHKTHLEAIQTVQKLSYLLDEDDAERVEVVICPAFTSLRSVGTLLDADRLPYRLGAQDVFPSDEGAFTGEVSPPMLAALEVHYVIVGHSERRQLFGEDDLVVNKKARAVFAHGMTPILCVGETLEERDAGGTETKVARQIRRGFDKVDGEQAATAVVAYEPIWAIGTGRNAEPADAGRVVEVIRATLAERYDDDTAHAVRIQYGGSVKPGNIREFMAHPEIDGALVGGASLDPDDLALIVKYR